MSSQILCFVLTDIGRTGLKNGQSDEEDLVLRQHIIVRDSEIARTGGLLMVRGNSDSRLLSRPIN